uniref:Uncharacterized protein n=1 Tax=Panagrolaimus sp. PS1159 TaxID=55785 RepID=A0AC35FMJ2_9BILA
MVENCIIADCEVFARYSKIVLAYFGAFIICCFIPVAIWCAGTKAAFLFYRCWKTINDRSDNLKPTFSNARKLAQVTWSELHFTQRQIEKSRFKISKDLSAIENIRRQIQKDVNSLPSRRQVYFVEPHRRSSSSSSSSNSPSSMGRSTAC